MMRLVSVNTEWNTVAALSDLAVLTPPFMVAAAFLIAVGAFVRHEMRAAKKHPPLSKTTKLMKQAPLTRSQIDVQDLPR